MRRMALDAIKKGVQPMQFLNALHSMFLADDAVPSKSLYSIVGSLRQGVFLLWRILLKFLRKSKRLDSNSL